MSQDAHTSPDQRLANARAALTLAAMEWGKDISNMAAATKMSDCVEELEAAAAAREFNKVAWRAEPIMAGYAINGYRIVRGNEEPIARTIVKDEGYDEEAAELLVAALNAYTGGDKAQVGEPQLMGVIEKATDRYGCNYTHCDVVLRTYNSWQPEVGEHFYLMPGNTGDTRLMKGTPLDYQQQALIAQGIAAGITDSQANAVYDAVTRSNLTRDVKSFERKAQIVRDALTPPVE